MGDQSRRTPPACLTAETAEALARRVRAGQDESGHESPGPHGKVTDVVGAVEALGTLPCEQSPQSGPVPPPRWGELRGHGSLGSSKGSLDCSGGASADAEEPRGHVHQNDAGEGKPADHLPHAIRDTTHNRSHSLTGAPVISSHALCPSWR